MDEDDGEKSFCYIEGTSVDKNAAEEVTELHENVWYRMKPPKQSTTMYTPFVTARQIDLIRNMLLGKTALKPSEITKTPDEECLRDRVCRRTLRRDEIEQQPTTKIRKSSVKFLNESVYDDL